MKIPGRILPSDCLNVIQDLLPVSCPSVPLLFILHEPASDLEVGRDLQGIDILCGCSPCALHQVPNLFDEREDGFNGYRGFFRIPPVFLPSFTLRSNGPEICNAVRFHDLHSICPGTDHCL